MTAGWSPTLRHVADGDWTPEIALDRNVAAVVGAATAWSRSVSLLHDAADADPASENTRRWNTAVDAIGEALDQLCDALASGDPSLKGKARFFASDPDTVREMARQVLSDAD